MRVYRNLIIALMLLLVASAGDAQAAYYGERYYVAVDQGSVLRLRQEPSTRAHIVLNLQRGTEVIATGGRKDEWFEVEVTVSKIVCDSSGTTHTTGTLAGWVHSLSLSIEEPYTNISGRVNSDKDVSLCDKPGGDEEGILYNDTTLSVLAVLNYGEGNWYRVKTGEVCGWVASDYVEIR